MACMADRMRFLAAAFLLALTQLAVADDDMRERLAACAACHGEQGQGIRGAEYFPHLAGKPSGYLLEQLQGFREGRRANTQMTWLVQYLDDAYMKEIADYYSQLPPRTHAADAHPNLAPDQATLAAKLVNDGDESRQLPACSACHGKNLAGLQPGVPALVALPADYVAAQLGAWRIGTRKSVAPDCMHDVAVKLSQAEIVAIANYLSGQSNDESVKPADAGSFAPPVACGALPRQTP
jgi:cytochrome c553